MIERESLALGYITVENRSQSGMNNNITTAQARLDITCKIFLCLLHSASTCCDVRAFLLRIQRTVDTSNSDSFSSPITPSPQAHDVFRSCDPRDWGVNQLSKRLSSLLMTRTHLQLLHMRSHIEVSLGNVYPSYLTWL